MARALEILRTRIVACQLRRIGEVSSKHASDVSNIEEGGVCKIPKVANSPVVVVDVSIMGVRWLNVYGGCFLGRELGHGRTE